MATGHWIADLRSSASLSVPENGSVLSKRRSAIAGVVREWVRFARTEIARGDFGPCAALARSRGCLSARSIGHSCANRPGAMMVSVRTRSIVLDERKVRPVSTMLDWRIIASCALLRKGCREGVRTAQSFSAGRRRGHTDYSTLGPGAWARDGPQTDRTQLIHVVIREAALTVNGESFTGKMPRSRRDSTDPLVCERSFAADLNILSSRLTGQACMVHRFYLALGTISLLDTSITRDRSPIHW
jgi:hypothetical protein